MRAHLPLAGLLVLLAACGGATPTPPTTTDSTVAQPDPNSGGAMTVNDATSAAFGLPAPNLSAATLAQHVVGDGQFDAVFVPAPAPVNPGLGPRFDNNACNSCHVNDGRGHPPTAGEQFNSMLFRISIPGTAADGGPVAVPMHGTQLRTRAIVGLSVPTASVTYSDSGGAFADGTTYSLQVPHYVVSDPFYPLPSDVLVSPRVAPVNFGLGLLEAIPEATVLALVSSSDAVAAGVSGRPNYVWDVVAQKAALGRFGLKANVPTIVQQVAAAYQGDMGVTNSLFPDEPCQDPIPGCAAHAPDLSDSLLQATSAYIHTLGVPVRRDVNNATVVRGQQLFQTLGCTGCHTATITTGSVATAPEASNQKIHPYTDLLLHDMGAALADNRPDYQASGQEWRTPPLWGIGLTAIVNGHTNFLHDGRARSLLEAIMWHGGEAERQREAVRALSAADRNALIAFLQSL